MPTEPEPILWPFQVDWSSPYKVDLTFKTGIFTSRDGREQRWADRSTPRKSLDFSATVERRELQAFRALMASAQNKSMIMPEVTRLAYATGSMAAGATVVQVDRSADWLTPGFPVVLIYGDQSEARTVESVSGNTITFTDGGKAWPGGAVIHPGLIGLLSSDLDTQMVSDDFCQIQVTFDVDPGTEPTRSVGEPVATLLGREVFTTRPNWRGGVNVGYAYPIEQVDWGRGRIETIRPVIFGTQTFRATFTGMSPAEVFALQQFFERQKGQRGEFYMSSDLDDMPPLRVTAPQGGSTLRVQGELIAEAFSQDKVHRAIAVQLDDGRVLYRHISALSIISDGAGDDTIITVNEPWPSPISPGIVSRISWLPICRHATDKMTIEWTTQEVAEVRFTMSTLPELPKDDV